MANPRYEGKTRVFWVDTVSNIDAPTVAEITAGVDITTFLPKDGLAHNQTFSKVDRSNLSSEFDAEGQATWGIPSSLKILRDDVTDTAWDLFTTHATAGFLVKLPFKGTGAVAAADVAEVYPCEASIAVPMGTAANERQMAAVDLAVTSEPSLSAAVAA